ncbi:sugar ABC transporter substrate-binding protein [Vannielia litorea]|uniref:Monosaccharide ABC transporter substrate-binding protein, CUT2 family n=1 Tax=Vannielia litorea TaxID=1217970 RepID=A0A1N6E132_9RHOB|nr:sugar ABC transporter substrate-binding protein [Vannielia litorea]SIN76738.1 monosaccharide ABC transporter substrate-binding protein, CUT2 family [Vannielia litorea]
MKLTKLKTALAAGALTLASGSAVVAQDLRIAYTGYSTDNTFWIGVANAAAAEAEAQDVEFIDMTASSPDSAAQRDAVDRAIDMGVDGIIIGSVDNRAFDASLEAAAAKGIPVVAVDTGIDHPHVSSLVQTDNLAAAGIAGDYIVDQIDGGKVLILGGSAGHQTGNARRDGVLNAAEAAGHEVIFQICDWQDACAFETTTNFLQSDPEITAIFSAWDPGALAAVSAAKALGRLDDLVIVGFDGNPANLVAIAEGEQSATIKQDNTRMGTESVRNLLAVINGEEAPAVVPIDGILITADNVAEYQ